ncbi:polysaccharide deacetylase [Hypnocyclicus thermotrophus]|uniref:Polysaccharide deacetylase n=1 Tax=Hypnocyclicus thermotrophus TaxID=1627895 RepID=A0AA46I6F4_9FUSO|nr:polysaccharide deacetylase family protein [Hypnocyclicus thermotrophus]TDT72341.1 polysaccharide deacetylase [Hypnocyclicus thermotrophus]
MNFKNILIILFIIFSYSLFADGHIFVYHRFGDNRFTSSNISISTLRKHFDYLKNNNYKVVSLKNMVSKIKNNEEIPDNWVAFTIDDAYKSFYNNGLPVFKEYNYPFTLFANTEPIIGKYPDFVTFEELRDISKYGEVATHSHSHQHSLNISTNVLLNDIKKSVNILEKELNKKINYYSHPYGEYDYNILNYLKNLNFQAIFNQNSGAISNKNNIYDLNRIALGENDNIEFWLNIKYLIARWNNIEIKNNSITNINVTLNNSIKQIEVYISGYGWKWYNLNNGILNINLNKPLLYSRNRIILRTKDNKWNNYLIVK